MKKRKRKIILPALLLGAAVLIGAYVLNTRKPEAHYPLSKDLRLTFTNADAVIDQLREALSRHDYQIHLTFTSADGYMDDILPLADELMKYAMAETPDPTQGDYIRYQTGGYDVSWGHEQTGETWTYTVTITPKYYLKVAQEETVDRDIKKVIRSMHFMPWTSDYEKVKKIHDYVCSHVSYDTIHKSSEYHLKSTAYAALERGSAGCQGFSVLLYRLLRECGISCRVVTGIGSYEGKEEFHAWNIVALDGKYYNLDASWDSALEGDAYFLKGADTFDGHTRDAEFLSAEFTEAYPMSGKDYEPEH